MPISTETEVQHVLDALGTLSILDFISSLLQLPAFASCPAALQLVLDIPVLLSTL